jgi:cytochrome c oxidase cbb3-type subunit 3/ubiquinol-cytochrome c reductase cytochrome c subunit
MLTDAQLAVLARGMIAAWGEGMTTASLTPLPYASQTKGVPAQGQVAFATFCASCHGANGAGVTTKTQVTGSIVDPAYLALVSDQGLRSTILAGVPERGMPDWRGDLGAASTPHARAMTDQEVTDTVAWLASFRTPAPGQPYPQHP